MQPSPSDKRFLKMWAVLLTLAGLGWLIRWLGWD